MSLMNKQNYSQMIVDYILNQIEDKKLKKGDKLMTEQEFSDLLGVSRIPLREALCSLRTVGLLEAKQGGGSYVTSQCDPHILGRMMFNYAVLENVSQSQVIDVRALLEPEAARQAALQGSQRQKEEILQTAQAYQQEIEHYEGSEAQNERISELDRDLHQFISKASHNEFLWLILSITEMSSMELNRHNMLSGDNPNAAKSRQTFKDHHLEVAEAIMQGDGDRAYKIMEKHLQTIRQFHALSSAQ
ncbi:MAG: FadR family transcriptional regulator [Lachnospiraceae bacterium]|nr:FadR family transcriptional regulator [Lachnospiraceae bacterium]